ncbi:MAG: hypothetical protein K9H48_14395 [Melioribacteraceae bacterium]|nr:hypothetical protein [Melioribacteraceae bacterium]MCF8394661.1 hypothetical protein [Melioribacteraceae bacterium]MCF8418005.1 hypothetical protein [Melioribacteraceae bacterium]
MKKLLAAFIIISFFSMGFVLQPINSSNKIAEKKAEINCPFLNGKTAPSTNTGECPYTKWNQKMMSNENICPYSGGTKIEKKGKCPYSGKNGNAIEINSTKLFKLISI